MKNIYYACFAILVCLCSTRSQAQLYVKNSYVYVANDYIYVKKDIELSTVNSHLFLRNGAQLLQGTTSGGSNKGVGSTSIYQEGTSNQFAYNYWASPVGNANIVAANSAFSITQLGAPISVTQTIFTTPLAWGSPSGTSTTGAVAIASRWIYRFVSNLNYSDWIYAGTTATINPGEGFTMKGVGGTDVTAALIVGADGTATNNAGNAQRYDFRGKPNDGNIVVDLAAGLQTLAGNPYPSAIDMQVFLSAAENPNCDGTAQYWEQPNTYSTSHFLSSYKGGYGIYNGLTDTYIPAIISSYDGAGNITRDFESPGTIVPRKFCPVAQGFMLTGTSTSTGTVMFKNTHRVVVKENITPTFSTFNKSQSVTQASTFGNYPKIANVAQTDYTLVSTAPTPKIVLKTLINNDMIRQTNICFLDAALDGVDRADSKSPTVDDGLPFDQYFAIGNSEYVQTTTAFGLAKKFALGFKNTQQATFKIKVGEIINFNGLNEIYLHDKTTDLYYDIKNQSQEVTLLPGVNNTRYEITFSRGTLSDQEFSMTGFDVFQNNVDKSLTIKNPNLINIDKCEIFDITGKMICNKFNLGAEAQFNFTTENFSDGVYIVSIITADGIKTSKKVLVSQAR